MFKAKKKKNRTINRLYNFRNKKKKKMMNGCENILIKYDLLKNFKDLDRKNT